MPSPFIVRSFAENHCYHVFNRGVEKRIIFEDEQDYRMFRYYLSVYLLPTDTLVKFYPKTPLRLFSKNLCEEIDLIAYCLIPNHFHLLLKQRSIFAISRFMKQLINGYTSYFNQKYKRVGGLLQGRFKAALVNSDDLLLHVSRYIHLNPLIADLVKDLNRYPWSSFLEYVTDLDQDKVLCKKEIILSQFPNKESYKRFVLDQEGYARQLDKIKSLLID